MRFKLKKSGYTLIELMLVVAILSVLASILSPRIDLVLQRAYQSKARNNLGSLRSAIALYYSEQEGKWPMANYAAGIPTESLSSVLTPNYMQTLPTPKVLDRVGSFNSLALNYDTQSEYHMTQNPPEDIIIIYGPRGPSPFVDRPYVYNPQEGDISICNDNYAASGEFFWTW